jgi:hypothetical protein
MKSNFLLAVSAIIAPAVAASQTAQTPPQTTQTPPSPGATQSQTPPADANVACDQTGKPVSKSANAKNAAANESSAGASSSESVKSVQKDTGDAPPPAKKSKSEDSTTCPTSPQ